VRLPTLKTRAEFSRVKNGSKWAAKSFVLQAMVRDGDGGPVGARFGFTVASRSLIEKNEGNKGQPPKRPGAVMRNRAKRRLKEAVRLLAPVYARAEYDYVIISRREALHQTFSDLLEDFRIAFGKVHRPQRGKHSQPPSRGGREQVKATVGEKTDAASGGDKGDAVASFGERTGARDELR
jgi:ribonuclease P protein component